MLGSECEQRRDDIAEFISYRSWVLYDRAGQDLAWSDALAELGQVLGDLDPADPRLLAVAAVWGDLDGELLDQFRSHLDADGGLESRLPDELLSCLVAWLESPPGPAQAVRRKRLAPRE